jgi:hypothetical protein
MGDEENWCLVEAQYPIEAEGERLNAEILRLRLEVERLKLEVERLKLEKANANRS